MKTANNILVLAALLAGAATGWLGASDSGGARHPERADGNLSWVASPGCSRSIGRNIVALSNNLQ